MQAALAWWAQGAPSGDPNGYLALAKYCVDHVEQYIDGAMGCDTTVGNCGRSASADADWSGAGLFSMAMVYDIVHSQLSSTEIANFANKVLNDNTAAQGGIDTVACTPQPQTLETGTISTSTSSTTVTGTGTSFSGFAVGGVLLEAPPLYSTVPSVLGFISSVGSNTSITLTSDPLVAYTGNFYYSPPWNNNCGMIWFYKHNNMAPQLTAGQANFYQAGGSSYTSYAGPWSNLTWPQTVSYFAMGMVLAGDDSRAQTLVTQAYNYYLTQEHSLALSSYSGVPVEGAGYPHGRQAAFTSLFLALLQGAVVSPPSIGGTLVKRWAQEFYLMPFPYSPSDQISYGTGYGERYYQFASGPNEFGPIASYLLGTSTEGKNLNYIMLQSAANGGRGDYVDNGDMATSRGSYAWLAFIYAPSPANTSVQTDYRTGPTQFIFNQTDVATCTSLGLTCAQVPAIYTFMMSKSDWTKTATEVVTNSGVSSWGFDHMLAVYPGSVHIYRGGPLLAGDGGCQDGVANGDYCDVQNGLGDTIPMLGAFNVNNNGGYNCAIGNAAPNSCEYAPVTRWAGVTPTGDASSRYAYEMIDLTQAYVSSTNPTRVQRSIIHFKKSGTQDYVVVYDDMATSSGNLKTAYWHYFVGNGEATESSGSNTVTLTRGSTARLLTSFLAIPGSNSVVMTDEGTSYPGNQGHNNTDRVNICGSSNGATCDSTLTAAEFLTVHLPTTNTSASMPTITQPSCSATGGNCTAVQIEDLAAAEGSGLCAAGSHAHSGLIYYHAQRDGHRYLVAGMVPGNYSVSVNGATVVSSITVNANDYSLYFESTAGLVQIESSGTLTLAITPSFTPAAGTFSSAQAVTITTGTPLRRQSTTRPMDLRQPPAPRSIPVRSRFPPREHFRPSLWRLAIRIARWGRQLTPSSSVAATPAFTPVAGTYSSAQAVTISTTTPSATIYYTTDGSTPTTSSSVYSGPIAVSATETVQAIAVALWPGLE